MNKIETQSCDDIAKNRYIKECYKTARKEILEELKGLDRITKLHDRGAISHRVVFVEYSEIQKIIERLEDNEQNNNCK